MYNIEKIMKRNLSIIMAALALAWAQGVRADFVAGNYDGTSSTYTSNPDTSAGYLGNTSYALGQEFTAGSTASDLSLTVPLASIATSQNYSLSIVTDNS